MVVDINKIYKDDVLSLIKQIPNDCLDIICTDPPYLYLKGQKLDRPFDEALFFKECHRVLKPDGFIILFGRGTSFYRWNVLLADLGMKFKEEVVWNKRRTSSPALALGRVHETVSIHSKGSGVINRVKINYGEIKGYDVDKIYADIKRLGGLFNKGKSYEKVVENIKKIQRGESYDSASSKKQGYRQTFQTERPNNDISTYTIDAMERGVSEQSIISDSSSHYGNTHPTQKPVRLIERLLSLVIRADQKQTCGTFFSGSGAHEEACINLGIDFIGCEIDDEYWSIASARTENIFKQKKQQLFT